MQDDALYSYIFNAQFWKNAGFRTKRAGEEIEMREKKYLEDYIFPLYQEVNKRRQIVIRYLKVFYKDEIQRCNENDEARSWEITQERTRRKGEQIKGDAIKEYAIEKVPWINTVNLEGFGSKQEIKKKLEAEEEVYSRITLDSIVGITPTSESYSMAEFNHFTNIADICSKYEDNPCSQDILNYLKVNNLI